MNANLHQTANPAPVVTGYLAKMHTPWDAEPALQVNPAASPIDLLGWCWGECASLSALADVLGCAGDEGEWLQSVDFSALLTHRLGPLCSVLECVIDRLRQGGTALPATD